MSTEIFWGDIFKKRDDEDSLYSFLKRNPVFSGLATRDIKKIERAVHIRRYKQGEYIFKEGEPGTGMYILKNGKVSINKIQEDVKNPKHIITLKKNHFFGELSLVEKSEFPRNASAIAETDCELIGFFKPDLSELIERDPHLSIKIVIRISEIIAARLRTTTETLSRRMMTLKSHSDSGN